MLILIWEGNLWYIHLQTQTTVPQLVAYNIAYRNTHFTILCADTVTKDKYYEQKVLDY